MSAVEARLAAIEARLAAVEARLASGSPSDSMTANDADLDSQWGDEIIKKDPKRWIEQGGDSFAGCRMSECPSEYLLAVASLFEWMASKDEEQGKTYLHKKSGEQRPTAPFARKTAARARGWAKRNRGNGAAHSHQQNNESSGDSEVPF